MKSAFVVITQAAAAIDLNSAEKTSYKPRDSFS